MSVVLDRLPAPAGIPAERPLWRLRRTGRTAAAFERVYSQRWELRVYIGAEMPFHRTYSSPEAARRQAADVLSQFERQGWTPDEVAGPIWHILQSSM